MRIVERTGQRLVLAGIPGGTGVMIAFTAIGGVLTAAVVAAAVHEIKQGNHGTLVPIGIGMLVAQALFWAGVITLVFARERLELDRVTGRGRYTICSPIVDTGNSPFEFDLASVDSVSLELTLDSTSAPGPGGFDRRSTTEVYRARLRILRPRRGVVLLERSESGREQALGLAREVAGFLGVDFADATADPKAEPERRTPPRPLTRPLTEVGEVAALSFPPQPEPPEWGVEIDPDAPRLTITRLKRGGPRVLIFFLLIATFMMFIAGAMAAGVWLPGQTFNGKPILLYQQLLITAPGIVVVVLVPWLWVSLLAGRRRVEIDPHEIRSLWIYPGRRFVRLLPALNRFLAGGERAPTAGVESVTTIKGAQGRVVEVRAGRARLRIGSAHTDEAAERASLVWLAKAIRAAVRTLGPEA